MKFKLLSSIGVLAIGVLALGACEGGSEDPTGAAGTNATGAAGTSATGAAGTSTTGAAGTSATGAAGTSATGAAGTSATGAAGTSATGAAGTGAAGTGATGAAGTGATGAAGSGAAGTSATGTAGTGAVGTDLRKGKSSGCGKAPPAADSPGSYAKHDITVTGVDPAYITAHPANLAGYTWTKRNYFLKLPAGYDPGTGYALQFGGGGCGSTNGTSGSGGSFQASVVAPGAIQVGLSYLYGDGQGACFQDSGTNTPEVPFFDAVMKEIDANYCFDKGKVFIAGYSSGAWEAYTLGFARGNVIRGIGTAAGGIRAMRPPGANVPFAAYLLTGDGDTSNPADGPTGSKLARDTILMINKCVGTATTAWAPMASCVQYTGCPAAFPVIWCQPPGGHTDGGGGWKTAMGAAWSALPPVP